MTMYFQLPLGSTSISINGITPEVHDDGTFEVPDELGERVAKEVFGVTRVSPPQWAAYPGEPLDATPQDPEKAMMPGAPGQESPPGPNDKATPDPAGSTTIPASGPV